MREHCRCLTAALITARCSVSTLGVNTWEHCRCGDLTIHKHAHTHTHTQAGTPCIQRQNNRAGTWMTHSAFMCVSLVGCSPTRTTFPARRLSLQKTKHGLTALSSLAAAEKETNNTNAHTFTHSLAFSLTCYGTFGSLMAFCSGGKKV